MPAARSDNDNVHLDAGPSVIDDLELLAEEDDQNVEELSRRESVRQFSVKHHHQHLHQATYHHQHHHQAAAHAAHYVLPSIRSDVQSLPSGPALPQSRSSPPRGCVNNPLSSDQDLLMRPTRGRTLTSEGELDDEQEQRNPSFVTTSDYLSSTETYPRETPRHKLNRKACFSRPHSLGRPSPVSSLNVDTPLPHSLSCSHTDVYTPSSVKSKTARDEFDLSLNSKRSFAVMDPDNALETVEEDDGDSEEEQLIDQEFREQVPSTTTESNQTEHHDRINLIVEYKEAPVPRSTITERPREVAIDIGSADEKE